MKYYFGEISVDFNSSLVKTTGVDIRFDYFDNFPLYITKYLQKWFYFYLNDIVDPLYAQVDGNNLSLQKGAGRFVGAYLKGQQNLPAILESNTTLNNNIPGFTLLRQVSTADIPRSTAEWRDESKILWKQYLHGDISLTHRNKTYDVLGSTRQYLYSVNTDDYEHPLLWVKDLFEELVQSKK